MTDERAQRLISDAISQRLSRREIVRRALAMGLSAPVVAMVLAACGGGSSNPTPTQAQGSAATQAPSGQPTAASGGSTGGSAATPVAPATITNRPKGGTLVVGQAGDVDSLDNDKALGPSKLSIIQYTEWQMIGKGPGGVSNGVKMVDATKSVPRVIEKWDVKDLPDGKQEYTLTVRKGAKHHSGNPVTIHDVIFTYQRRRAFKRDAFELTNFFPADDDHIKVLDDYSAAFTTDAAARFFLEVPAQRNIVDSAKIKQEAGASDPWGEQYMTKGGVNAQGVDSGGGPFRLTKWTQGVELEFDRFDDWWANSDPNEAVVLDKVNIRTIPSTDTRLLLLQRGEIDIALDLPQREINRLKSVSGVKVISVPSTNQLYIGMTPDFAPFDNVKARQAMNYAFPYQAAIEQVFGGAATRMTGCVQVGVAGALDKPMYETDLNKAKQLLQEAGYGSGAEVTLSYSANFATHEELAILYQANLKQVGVNCQLQKLQQAEFNTITRQKKLPFFFYEALWWVLDPQYSLDSGFVSTAQTNLNNWNDPALDKKLEEARNIRGDEKKRTDTYTQINRDLTERAPYVFVAHPHFNLAMSDKVDGYVYQNTELHHLWLLSKKK